MNYEPCEKHGDSQCPRGCIREFRLKKLQCSVCKKMFDFDPWDISPADGFAGLVVCSLACAR